MELKLADKINAAVQIGDETIINMENSVVYESIENDKEAFIYIKSADGTKEVKIRFLKKE